MIGDRRSRLVDAFFRFLLWLWRQSNGTCRPFARLRSARGEARAREQMHRALLVEAVKSRPGAFALLCFAPDTHHKQRVQQASARSGKLALREQPCHLSTSAEAVKRIARSSIVFALRARARARQRRVVVVSDDRAQEYNGGTNETSTSCPLRSHVRRRNIFNACVRIEAAEMPIRASCATPSRR